MTRRVHSRALAAGIGLVSASLVALSCLAQPSQTILSQPALLRAGAVEWQKFSAWPPAGKDLTLDFDGPIDPAPAALLIDQDDVKREWRLELNHTPIGALGMIEAPLRQAFSIPAALLKQGRNQLVIRAPKETDDIVLHRIFLVRAPLEQWLRQAEIEIEVHDRRRSSLLPSRITIVTTNGFLAPIAVDPNPLVAMRTGVLYTGNGRATVHLPAGRYLFYASRGFEYSRDKIEVSLAPGSKRKIQFALTHEVDLPDWISSDTHMHTFTLSGHGDATLEERVLTLAGEGIELPISTEHNVASDYNQTAARLGMQRWLTAIPGEEVTTSAGHFNIFPITAGAPLPDPHRTNWAELLPAIRRTPGVELVILNHPRDLHSGFRPFDRANFNPITGAHRFENDLSVDAIELINSGAQQSDLMQTFRDWFALLNHGHHFSGVGASDSHDVSRYIVGQGRTYVKLPQPRSAFAPADLGAVCRSFQKGASAVSLGLLTQIEVNGHFGPGDLVSQRGHKLKIEIKIFGPSWSRADQLAVYANGEPIIRQRLKPSSRPGLKAKMRLTIPRRDRDYYLVAIASGPGITEPFWRFAPPYQLTSLSWESRCISSTNPVWVDADGDGAYTPPRQYATELLAAHQAEPAALVRELDNADLATVIQAADIIVSRGIDAELETALKNATVRVRQIFAQVEKEARIERDDIIQNDRGN